MKADIHEANVEEDSNEQIYEQLRQESNISPFNPAQAPSNLRKATILSNLLHSSAILGTRRWQGTF